MVKKDKENMKIQNGMGCPLPQSQKEEKSIRKPTAITFPYFLMTLGVFRCQMCPVTSGPVDNSVGLRSV